MQQTVFFTKETSHFKQAGEIPWIPQTLSEPSGAYIIDSAFSFSLKKAHIWNMKEKIVEFLKSFLNLQLILLFSKT